MYKIILAENPQDANAYAKAQGIRRGTYRYAVRASSIAGLRVAEIHELPSFANRRDKHAINAELRRCGFKNRHMVRIVVEADPPEDHFVSNDAPYALPNRFVSQAPAAPAPGAGDESPDVELDTHGVPTRQRRSRCSVCGQLVWNDEDENHDSEMHAQAAVRPVTTANFFGGQ